MEAESDKYLIQYMGTTGTTTDTSSITYGGGGTLGGSTISFTTATPTMPSPWLTTTPAEPEDLNGALVIQRKGQPFPNNVKNCTLLYDGMPLEEKIKMVALWLKDNG